MIAATDEASLHKAVERARSLAGRSFGSADVYLEKLIERPRHIEFQVLGDRHGEVRHLFERDCSLQRRHQKIIEEATAPNIPRGEIEAVAERAVAVLRAARLRQYRHRRDAARRGWQLRLPRDEHPPAGRARRHRDAARRRSRRRANPRRRAASACATSCPPRSRRAATPSRRGSTRKTRKLLPVARPAHPIPPARRGRAAARRDRLSPRAAR